MSLIRMLPNAAFVFRAALLATLFAALPAHAEMTDEDMCRSGLFPSQDSFQLATVGTGTPRLYFYGDMDGCPQKGAACQAKPYVVPGDHLLLGKRHGEWSCAWYEGKGHETVGWMRNTDLRIEPDKGTEASDFGGAWTQYDYPGRIVIARKDGAWQALGKTKWIGLNTEHYGTLAGVLAMRGRHAHLGAGMEDADDCGADLTRIGDFLVVHDNARCGGVNVRFDGVYTRAALTSASRDGGSTGKARSR